MTMIKKLPLTMAVIAAFFPLTSVMAQEFTQEPVSYTHLTLPTSDLV